MQSRLSHGEPAAEATTTGPPEIPARLPASLLQRRPDVVAAERNLEAANARIVVSKAAFFPTIKLAGAAGYASADLNTLALQADTVNRALVSACDSATLANDRHRGGPTSCLDVVDAQRSVLQDERHDSQLRGQRAVSTLLLVEALGA